MMESLLVRNRGILPLEQIKEVARTFNTTEYFVPPLDNGEFEKQWGCALKFVLKKESTTFPNSINIKDSPHSSIEEYLPFGAHLYLSSVPIGLAI